MTALKQKMIRDLSIRGFAEKTKSAYIRHIEQYAKHFGKSPQQLEDEDIKNYINYLITEKKVSISYVNGVYSALKFLYTATLNREWEM